VKKNLKRREDKTDTKRKGKEKTGKDFEKGRHTAEDRKIVEKRAWNTEKRKGGGKINGKGQGGGR